MYSIIPQDVRAGIANPGRLEQQFMEMLRSANLKFDNSKTIAVVDFFDTKNFNAISNAVFFDGNSSATAGETNVNSTVRPQSEHALIYGAKIVSGEENDRLFANTSFRDGITNLPRALANGQFQVQVNGVNQTAKIPLTRTTSGGGQAGGTNPGMFYFDVPWFWPGQQDLKIRVETAANTATPAADAWMQLQVFGIGLIS